MPPRRAQIEDPAHSPGNLHKGIDSLYASPLYRELKSEQMAVFFDSARVQRLPSGTILYTPDDTPERLYFVESGRIILYTLTPGGKRLVKRHILPGSTFGMIGLLGHSLYRNFAEAIEESEVRVVAREDVLALLRKTPDMAIRLLEVMGDRILMLEEILEQRFVNTFYDTVRVRLARLLLLNSDPQSGALAGITQEEIADAVGAVRQSVADAMSLMRKQGLIRTGFKTVKIVDWSILQRIAEGSDR